ncbi:hypothetical protein [Acetobacterium sp. UBA5834]|jgi:hypothetical protein|uniref:hypothetical protein n=1 Tax=Acetobacterium sp. UBA5834 TaxID=1945907 RepID=UPI00257B0778|nr:hypothetical protein [Acetobacterium sp. UBA5834]
MGFFDLVWKVAKGAMDSSSIGSSSLRSAAENSSLNTPSVYELCYQGQLMKVGKVEDGLRKRFCDYYRGKNGGTAYLKYIDETNRDGVFAKWRKCERNQCRALETQMYDAAKARGEELPWSDRR